MSRNRQQTVRQEIRIVMNSYQINKSASSLLLLTALLISACGSSKEPLSDLTSVPPQIQSTNSDQAPTLAAAQLDPYSLPLASIEDFEFIGGFRIPAKQYAGTSFNYAKGVIEQSGNSLFMVGHEHHDMIAEFAIPELVNSEVISELIMADDPIQLPVSVLGASSSGNSQSIDDITGLEVINNRLIINAKEYYDAPADNSHTTLIADNAFGLASSEIGGYYELRGAAHAGGWLSPIPAEWQAVLGGDYMTGYSSGDPIISRLSVGPSAFVVKSTEFSRVNAGDRDIRTTKLMDFSLRRPLHEDLFNESRNNDLWTHTSNAVYGFIVPGTRTYATFGHTSGITSGVGYKVTQDDGSLCPGYCSNLKADQSNYYWLWDVKDLASVKQRRKISSSIKPYAYGKFDVPYQTNGTINRIGGASFDEATGTLLFSVLMADTEQGEFTNPPVIAGYQLNLR